MPQIPSRLPREYESPSPDHRTRYTRVVDTVLKYNNVWHLQRVSQSRRYHGTKSEHEILGDVFLIGVDVANM